MTGQRKTQLATWLVALAATLAMTLAIAPAKAAAAGSVDCPGVHNISVVTFSNSIPESRHNSSAFLELVWENPISLYEAVLFCDDIIGIDMRDAQGVSQWRLDFTPAEFALKYHKRGYFRNAFPSYSPIAEACEYSAILYTQPPGSGDWFAESETVHADRWGTAGCRRLSDVISTVPSIGFAPVVSTNPPSIEP